MTLKKIEAIYAPQNPHMVGDGFRVHNFIPHLEGLSMRDMDPFILLDYNSRMMVHPSKHPKGVGVHPHRGFETVTIAYEGEVEHHDSYGNHGIIHSGGDVQWMTAARGVLHKEYLSRELTAKGGLFQMVQLWVNLPAKYKMSEPHYQALASDSHARVELPEGGVVKVIAGEYKGVKGPAKTFSPVNVMNAYLGKGEKAVFSTPATFTTALLAIDGNAYVNGTELPSDHFLKFSREGEEFTIEGASDNTVVLLISGKPLNEPIASYGPFVMNTEAEIRQSIMDFDAGKFGYLAD